jgi:hypothetical protein
MAPVNNKLIKNFFTKEELNILQKYCYNKLDRMEINSEPVLSTGFRIDHQSFSPAWYNDELMNSLLETKLSLVESESKLNLFPTFAYWRYYVFGGSLKKHMDRPSCEVAVTACIKKYDNWPVVVEGNSFELEEGDGILFAANKQKHWRPGVYKGDGLAQVIMFYVNKKGPYTDHAYDTITKENKVVEYVRND